MHDIRRLIDIAGREPLSEGLYDEKQVVLDQMDRLLGSRLLTKQDKVRAFREIAEIAERMADGIRRGLRGE